MESKGGVAVEAGCHGIAGAGAKRCLASVDQTEISDVGASGQGIALGAPGIGVDADDFAMPGVIAPNAIVESLMKFRLVAIRAPSENELCVSWSETLSVYTHEVNTSFASKLSGIRG